MGMNKAARRFTAWIACFAILLASLAPSISYAVAASANPNLSEFEICSIAGLKLIKVADKVTDSRAPTKPSAPAGTATHSEHCPFCFTHAGSFGLLPTAVFSLPVASKSPLPPALLYQAPRPLFMWTAAQSRAPPAIS
jgi:hypothetical protein